MVLQRLKALWKLPKLRKKLSEVRYEKRKWFFKPEMLRALTYEETNLKEEIEKYERYLK